MLVVRSAREINELRYVLCPKRMSDAQFWQIYFLLAKKLLPDEAFDPAFQPPRSAAPGLTLNDLQARTAHPNWLVLHKSAAQEAENHNNHACAYGVMASP